MATMALPSPPEPVDATLLPQLYDLYLQERNRKRPLAAQTLANYQDYIGSFVVWVAEQPTPILDVAALVRYQQHVAAYRTPRGLLLTRSSQAERLKRLRRFLGWCYRQGCTGGVNLAELVPQMADIAPSTHFPTLAELQRLFDAVEGVSRIRDLALLATLLATGARRMEAASIKVADLHLDAGYIHLRHTKGDAGGNGPGRCVVFDDATGRLLSLWLATRETRSGHLGGFRLDDRLFGLRAESVNSALRPPARRAGLPLLTPHALRRAFAEYWDEHNGAETYAALKLQLGHATGRDVTRRHYLDPRNYRRILATIRSVYVSPMREITIDWAALE